MSAYDPRLPEALWPLAKELESDRPNVVVMVGAGVSKGATNHLLQADWIGLLTHGLDYLVTLGRLTPVFRNQMQEALKSAFETFELDAVLEQADRIENNLKVKNSDVFGPWLKCAFADFRALPDEKETLNALSGLQRAGALLLTTNYDSLLAHAAELKPVTRLDRTGFLKAINDAKAPRIVHIHGHWETPKSVVFGSKSYQEILEDHDFQSVFKSLWLRCHWLYVGCGNGLEDPNLGQLLEWGRRWGDAAPPHKVLAIFSEAERLRAMEKLPPYFEVVEFEDFRELPEILRALTPAERCRPFVLIDANTPLCRAAGATPANNHIPSWQEYLDCEVPTLRADDDVRERLLMHGWACVRGGTQVGKTTLALRMAAETTRARKAAFYLNLSKTLDQESYEDKETKLRNAVYLIARSGNLLIVDNANRDPRLAHALWSAWRSRSCDSQLLLLATDAQQAAIVYPVEDFAHFIRNPDNPAITLHSKEGDLVRIMAAIFKRFSSATAALPMPPSEAVAVWHGDYGHRIGAFCFVVLGRLAKLQQRDWALPLEAANDWVWWRLLEPLSAKNLENVLCLAAFSTQELELSIPEDALPHPQETRELRQTGLVEESLYGDYQQHRRYSLKHQNDGSLLLAAYLAKQADGAPTVSTLKEAQLIAAAERDLSVASMLSMRWRSIGDNESVERMWKQLATIPGYVSQARLPQTSGYFLTFVREADVSGQSQLVNDCWAAVPREAQAIDAWIFSQHLGSLVSLIETARQYGKIEISDLLWQRLADSPHRLAKIALAAPQQNMANFLKIAHKNGQRELCNLLWQRIDEPSDWFRKATISMPLHFLSNLIDVAEQQEKFEIRDRWWKRLSMSTKRLAESALSSGLQNAASFLGIAGKSPQIGLCNRLWKRLYKSRERLVNAAFDTSMDHVAYFLEMAKKHQLERLCHEDICKFLWEQMAEQPKRVNHMAFANGLDHAANFLKVAQKQEQFDLSTRLWKRLSMSTKRLAESALSMNLQSAASFLEIASDSGQAGLCDRLWKRLAKSPERLADASLSASIAHTGRFLDVARQHEQSEICAQLWSAIERSPPQRLNKLLLAAPLKETLHFLRISLQLASDQSRMRLWDFIESEPDSLAKRFMAETDTVTVVWLLETIHTHGRDPQPEIEAKTHRWIELPALPQTLTYRILEHVPLGHWAERAKRNQMRRSATLASHCYRVGQHRHAEAIIRASIEHAHVADFASKDSGLSEAASLLHYGAELADFHRDRLLDALCNNYWLRAQYIQSKIGTIAKGLRLLALYQPVDIVRRFRNIGLRLRVEKEFLGFGSADAKHMSLCVQLLGCVSLCGFPIHVSLFANTDYRRLAPLPETELTHRKEAVHVQEWQYQLWLGLRTIVSVTRRSLPLAPGLIRQTRDLWRSNLERSALMPQSAEHRVDQQMVAWLETCLTRGECNLIPPKTRFLLPELAGPKPG